MYTRQSDRLQVRDIVQAVHSIQNVIDTILAGYYSYWRVVVFVGPNVTNYFH